MAWVTLVLCVLHVDWTTRSTCHPWSGTWTRSTVAGRVAIPDVSGDVRIPIKALLLTPTPSLQLHLVLYPTAIYRITDMPPKAKTSKKRARSPAATKAAGDKTQTRSSKRTKKDASVAAAAEPEAQVSNIPRPNDAFPTCFRPPLTI